MLKAPQARKECKKFRSSFGQPVWCSSKGIESG
jgi:hypothetical protein